MDRVTCRESCKRHMAVSGKVRRGKRGFSEMANDICTCKWNIIQLLCSFVVPELLKSALVLVHILVLVLVVVLVLVLVLVLVFLLLLLLLVVAAAHLIFAFFVGP